MFSIDLIVQWRSEKGLAEMLLQTAVGRQSLDRLHARTTFTGPPEHTWLYYHGAFPPRQAVISRTFRNQIVRRLVIAAVQPRFSDNQEGAVAKREEPRNPVPVWKYKCDALLLLCASLCGRDGHGRESKPEFGVILC